MSNHEHGPVPAENLPPGAVSNVARACTNLISAFEKAGELPQDYTAGDLLFEALHSFASQGDPAAQRILRTHALGESYQYQLDQAAQESLLPGVIVTEVEDFTTTPEEDAALEIEYALDEAMQRPGGDEDVVLA